MKKILLEFLNNSTDLLLLHNEHMKIIKDPGNLGSAREGLIKNFLSNNLPPAINYDSGEVFDCEGNRSNQMDIILTSVLSPRLNMAAGVVLFPVDTILSVIEVKSKLTSTGSLIKALKNCESIKKLETINYKVNLRISNTNLEMNKVPYILFAYDGCKYPTLLNSLYSHYNGNTSRLVFAPDIIFILSEGYCLVKTPSYFYKGSVFNSAYKKISNEKTPILLVLFEFLTGTIEYWNKNPDCFKMPLDRYTKDLPNLLRYFKK